MRIISVVLFASSLISCSICNGQLIWTNVDFAYAPLPKGFHVYKTTDPLDGNPNIAYYAIADLENKHLNFTVDTTYRRRITPQKFFEKNNSPLLVVNGTFFSFETNQNLNLVIKGGKLLSHNVRKVRERAGDTTAPFKDEKIIRGALGINKKRKADIAWVSSDSSNDIVKAWQEPQSNIVKGNYFARKNGRNIPLKKDDLSSKWKMRTAIGGGPVLVQNGKILISNEEERMFTGKAKLDKHPRTCIGYTKNGKLIIMVIQEDLPVLQKVLHWNRKQRC